MKSIATALVKAQMNMGKAQKKANNPHFRKSYADLGNVMDACLPALNEAGIAVIQPAGTDDKGPYIDTILVHGESGEQLDCRMHLLVQKNDMQGYGSAVTYARRYGLMTMAGIAPEDDDGNAAAKASPRQEQKQRKPDPVVETPQATDTEVMEAIKHITECESLSALGIVWKGLNDAMRHIAADKRVELAKDKRKGELAQ